MPNFNISPKAFVPTEKDGNTVALLKKPEFEKFSASILGLGDLKERSLAIPSVAAAFDLGGFTQFCSQIDPQLSVPEYMSRFLDWLMDQIKEETVHTRHPEGIQLWHPLPYFTKYTGDGIIVLWKTEEVSPTQVHNLVVSLRAICDNYTIKFLKTIKDTLVSPPHTLRCGVARGVVFSVGSSADYIGSCINIASRIQKLPGVTFAFNRRGFDMSENDTIQDDFEVRKVDIRGIGRGELLAIPKTDLKKMSPEDAKIYQVP